MYMMKEFLNGGIKIESFESVPDSQGRFTGGDERGMVSGILHGVSINFVEVAEFVKAGMKRGFHFHEQYEEQLYIISGSLKMIVRSRDGKNTIALDVHIGDLITIAPGIAHGFEAIEKTIIISMGNGTDPFKDRTLVSDLHL